MAMLDIRNGDKLVVGSDTYRVRATLPFDGWGSTASFKRSATVTASIKRTLAGATETTVIASLKCTPLDPASQDAQYLVATKTPYLLKETFAGNSSGFVKLIVEDLVRT